MTPTIKLTGILTDVFPVENFANFSKRAFWLKQPDTEQYPQHWELELHTRDIDRLKGIFSGSLIECEVAIRGRQYDKRGGGGKGVINNLQCIGITVVKAMERRPPGYIAKAHPGRESDDKRHDPQEDIPF